MQRCLCFFVVSWLLVADFVHGFSVPPSSSMLKRQTNFPSQLRWKSTSLGSSQQLEPQMSEVSKLNNYDNINPSVDITNTDSENYIKKDPKGSTPEFAIPGDSTVETPSQRAVLILHFALTAVNLAMATSAYPIESMLDIVKAVAVFALSVVLGDFGTGVFHWSVDNYGSINTPVFGTVCAAFQGHHITPWTITFRSFANNVYKICYATCPVLLLLSIAPVGPLLRMFLALFVTWWMISQELHKYSHMRTTPAFVKKVQDMGIILSKKEHGLHHTSPFEAHYCILTGICNNVLDKSQFFRYLEVIVYKLTGNKSNVWKEDPAVEEAAMKLLPW